MRRPGNRLRVSRLVEKIIADLSLDLMGIRVLTEAASGPFVVTPLIAARAGAERVVAVARDSCYGRAQEVKEYLETWARCTRLSTNIWKANRTGGSRSGRCSMSSSGAGLSLTDSRGITGCREEEISFDLSNST